MRSFTWVSGSGEQFNEALLSSDSIDARANILVKCYDHKNVMLSDLNDLYSKDKPDFNFTKAN